MLKQSSGSVEISWLDREAAVMAVKQAARRLARSRPEIKRIILFGSLARGDAVPGSDADLLIVLEESDLPFLERMSRYVFSGVSVGTDVFAYTEKELERMISEGNNFVASALSEGITMYQRRCYITSTTCRVFPTSAEFLEQSLDSESE